MCTDFWTLYLEDLVLQQNIGLNKQLALLRLNVCYYRPGAKQALGYILDAVNFAVGADPQSSSLLKDRLLLRLNFYKACNNRNLHRPTKLPLRKRIPELFEYCFDILDIYWEIGVPPVEVVYNKAWRHRVTSSKTTFLTATKHDTVWRRLCNGNQLVTVEEKWNVLGVEKCLGKISLEVGSSGEIKRQNCLLRQNSWLHR